MAKKPEKPKEPTPFEKFEQLAKRVVLVPKDHATNRKDEKSEAS